MMNYEKKIWFGTSVGAFLPFIFYLFIFDEIGKIVATFFWLVIMTVIWAKTDIKLTENTKNKDNFTIRQLKNRPFLFALIPALLGSATWVVLSHFVF